MMNANGDTQLSCGKLSLIASIAYQLQLSVSVRIFFHDVFVVIVNLIDEPKFPVDEKIFCCHGGLSPDLTSMEQIRRIMRPTDVPDQGLLCDLLWSDPDKDTMGWGENDRGVSFTFGVEVMDETLVMR